MLADPQGAVFAPYTPAKAPQVNDPPEPGEFSWHELATTDQSSALRFYQELFGWEKHDAMEMGGPVGVYQIFGWSGKGMGGIYNKPAEMPASPHWLPYATVADTRKAATAVTEAGGNVLTGPMEVPGGDLIMVGIGSPGRRVRAALAGAGTLRTQGAGDRRPAVGQNGHWTEGSGFLPGPSCRTQVPPIRSQLTLITFAMPARSGVCGP